ncbi:porin family protein [Saccharophagus degradans]|uniref:Porin family protein n=1 Tax=Saccharophagus degradans TaxID=86304 RepID=A0AAW7X2D9_9GAMM|nr:porin family protein [Saccharophagus degradans]MDO6421163.1 porin family protein [Saccharophagus degradans]MDO6605926.1 porin family protein [Saccharophagus degradans]WGO96470.1 porin family protein [Saccharophagus degradans]
MTKLLAKAQILILIGSVLALSQGAMADRERGVYIGGGLGQADIGVDNFLGGKIPVKTAELFTGYKYNNWLGLEVRMGASLRDETYALDSTSPTGRIELASLWINQYRSIYYRPEITNDIAKIYGLIGMTLAQTTSTIKDVDYHASAEGNSYGIGAGLILNEKTYFNLEYRILIETEIDTFSIIGFNVDYRF